MEYYISLRKKIYITVCPIITIISLVFVICVAKALAVFDFLFLCFIVVLSSLMSILILSKIIYIAILKRKFSFENSEKNIKTILRNNVLMLILCTLLYGVIIFSLLIDGDYSVIRIIAGTSIGIIGTLGGNSFLLFNDDFLIYDMKIFNIKDISDCWLCRDSNNMESLKILLNTNKTVSIMNSFYIDLDGVHNFIKGRIFIKNKFIEYGVCEDDSSIVRSNCKEDKKFPE